MCVSIIVYLDFVSQLLSFPREQFSSLYEWYNALLSTPDNVYAKLFYEQTHYRSNNIT